MERYATIVRYLITIAAAPIAAKLGLDATQTGSFQDWIFAVVMGGLTFTPMIWNLIFRPSQAAMELAVEADKVLTGEKKTATVKTPVGVPDITVTPETRGKSG